MCIVYVFLCTVLCIILIGLHYSILQYVDQKQNDSLVLKIISGLYWCIKNAWMRKSAYFSVRKILFVIAALTCTKQLQVWGHWVNVLLQNRLELIPALELYLNMIGSPRAKIKIFNDNAIQQSCISVMLQFI